MRALLLLAAVLPFLGCASVRPFSEIRRLVPADQFVRLGDQLVHVEQTGEGEPLILLHGFGASTYAWRKVIPGLAASFHVIAIDLNGFGYTERPRDFESYTREGQADLVLRVMDALGIGKAQFMSHSYGGGITIWLASRHPERLRSMVLVDSSAPTYSIDRRSRLAGVRPIARLGLRLLLRPGSVRRSLVGSVYDSSVVTPELVREYYDRLRIEGVLDAYVGLTAPVRTPPEPVRLESIQVPALLIWGSDDRLISVQAGRKAAGEFPHGEFVVLHRTGHLPMEERPEELLRTALPFLERHRG
jgi:pimeloyl-ACP methyl ester carboxylesterase